MKGRTVHVTVTVPQGLRIKMLRYQKLKRRRVNWSRIAVRAFRAHLKGKL